MSPHIARLKRLNDDKQPGCQINGHRGLTHSSHSSLGGSDARSSPNWLNIKRLCDMGCGRIALWIALIPGYIFSFHLSLSRRLTELPPAIIRSEYILYICLPKKKERKKKSPLLHTCLTGHCSLTTPNSPSSAIFDYFDFIAAATFCQLPNLTLSHEA